MTSLWLYASVSLVFLLSFPPQASSCNEAVCASIVSKCMLLQSCKCDMNPDCTCCKKCFECLDYLYSECCSCVDMCPKPNVTIHELSTKSHVEDLVGNEPVLFDALTSTEDPQNRWSIVTFPIDISQGSFKPTQNQDVVIDSTQVQHASALDDTTVTVNCTVVFMTQCVSWNKCKASCTSMGSASYRWFHDGCCECVGSQCINYGIGESRCIDCPLHDDTDAVDDFTDDEMDVYLNLADPHDHMNDSPYPDKSNI